MKVVPGSHDTAEEAAYKNVARRAAIGIEVVSDEVSLGLCDDPEFHEKMARPERFELPTFWFVGFGLGILSLAGVAAYGQNRPTIRPYLKWATWATPNLSLADQLSDYGVYQDLP